MNHLDEEIELYSLGMVSDCERARIDAHLTWCPPCTVKIGAAEGAVAALIDASQQRPQQRRTAMWPVAAAAAFAVAAAGLFGQNNALHGGLSSDGAMLATLVDSHFNHAQFQTPSGTPMAAKAIYDRFGRWYEVLTDGTPAWHVVFIRPDGTRDPATVGFVRRGAASIVYLASTGPVKSIDLEDTAGHVIGSVRPLVMSSNL
jgi:hypothetical protein